MKLKNAIRNVTRNVAAFIIVAVLFLFILWLAGYNFDGSWADPFEYDHPENFTHAQ